MENLIAHKRTKVVATLGPASESPEKLRELIGVGLNMARFNFSHGEHDWHKKVMQNVREVAQELGTSVAILADMQGPRIRTHVEKPVVLTKGEPIRIFDVSTSQDRITKMAREEKVITLDCPGMVEHLKKDHTIMIEDGIMVLKVIDVTDTHAIAEVVAGGTVKNHKGVNIPDAHVPLPAVTAKDFDDLEFALEQGVDYVAMSFVRTAQEVIDLRSHMKKLLQRDTNLPKIIAKIERKEALVNIEEILGAVDAIMVARGDLGIEVEPTRITLLQKDLIAKSLSHLRPVIVATQMLASMEHNPRPTRAEIADVTNAVVDHADAVMLSAETTVGAYPVETVRFMSTIAAQTEVSPYDDIHEDLALNFSSDEVQVARSSYEFSKEMDARAVVMYSESGFTARLLSHFRPERMILVATNKLRTYHQLALVWGVTPFLVDDEKSRSESIDDLIVQARDRGMLNKDDLVVTILGSTKGGKKLQIQGTRVV